MINAKRIAQLAKKWQRTAAGECRANVAGKGHCAVYTADGARFEVPLAYLGTALFVELPPRMSHEEFGFTNGDGRIKLPCDAAAMECAIRLLRRIASAEAEKALLSTMPMSCHYGNRAAPFVGASQQVAA